MIGSDVCDAFGHNQRESSTQQVKVTSQLYDLQTSLIASQRWGRRGKIITRGGKKKSTTSVEMQIATEQTEKQHVPMEKDKSKIPRNKESNILRNPVLRSQMKEKPLEGMEKDVAWKKRKLWIPPGHGGC